MRRESTKVKTKTRGRKQIRQVRKSANPKSQSEQNLRCRVFSDWDWRICRPFSHPQCRTLRCTQVCLKLSVTLKRKDRNRSDESANPPIPNPIRAEPPLPRLLGLGLADLGLADLPAVLPSSMPDITLYTGLPEVVSYLETKGSKQIRQVRKSANPKSQSEQNLRCRVFSDWDWRIWDWRICRPFSHPQWRTLRSSFALFRAVRTDAPIIRQSSLFSARIATMVSLRSREAFVIIRNHTAVSYSSFCTIFIL